MRSQNGEREIYKEVPEADGAKHYHREATSHERRETTSHGSKEQAKKGILHAGIGYKILLILMLVTAVLVVASLILMNSFPADLTIAIIVLMIGMLFIAAFLMGRSAKWKKITGAVMALLFLVVFGATSYYLGTTYVTLNKMSKGGFSNAENSKHSIDPTKDSFNLYITGIDQWESDKGEDLERSDVNMIVTVNPVTKKILLTSIPRDAYIKLHTAKQMDKLTHTGIYGVDETLRTVEDCFDVKLDYYVKMNFSGARNIITAMDGIKVYSPYEFDSDIMGYHYKKGWNTLSGKEALYFARERHAFEGKDSIRVENQQRVVKAVIKKMTSSPALLLDYGVIMNEAGDNLHTDMSYDEISDLVRMQLTDLSSWDIETQKIEGYYDQEYVASMAPINKYDVYKCYPGSVRMCADSIRETMHPSNEELMKSKNKRSRSFFVNAVKRLMNREEDQKE